MTINLATAYRVLDTAFPQQGVTIQVPDKPGRAFKVIAANGEVLGAAFDLQIACQQAVKPYLQEQEKRAKALDKARVEDFKAFMQFLREKHDTEFGEWVSARLEAQPAPSEPGGSEPDPVKLVSVPSPE